MEKQTKTILKIVLGLVATAGVGTGIYFLTKKKGINNKKFNVGNGGSVGNTSIGNNGYNGNNNGGNTPPPPKPKDFSKLNNVAIIYPSPDGFRWQYIDMSIEAANKFVNHDGYYRTDQPKHYFTSAIGGKRYRYALDFCHKKDKKHPCSQNRAEARYGKYLSYLRGNNINVIVANDSSDYVKRAKALLSEI